MRPADDRRRSAALCDSALQPRARYPPPPAPPSHPSSPARHLNETESRVYRYDGFQSRVARRQRRAADVRVSREPPPVCDETQLSPSTLDVVWSPALPVGTRARCATGEVRLHLRVNAGRQIPRLDNWLGGLPAGSLVTVPIERFADGPWCRYVDSRGHCGGGRFDADLLRIRPSASPFEYRRQVRSCGLNPSGRRCSCIQLRPLASSFLPDRTTSFEVTPANLNLSR
jgi:hypothetical protein